MTRYDVLKQTSIPTLTVWLLIELYLLLFILVYFIYIFECFTGISFYSFFSFPISITLQ